MHNAVRQKFESDFPLQLFIARQPDDAHSSAPENFDQRVAAEKFLAAAKLAQRRLQCVAARVVTHFASVKIRGTRRKRKAMPRYSGEGLNRRFWVRALPEFSEIADRSG